MGLVQVSATLLNSATIVHLVITQTELVGESEINRGQDGESGVISFPGACLLFFKLHVYPVQDVIQNIFRTSSYAGLPAPTTYRKCV
jgi:hypothetical protein